MFTRGVIKILNICKKTIENIDLGFLPEILGTILVVVRVRYKTLNDFAEEVHAFMYTTILFCILSTKKLKFVSTANILELF